MLKCASVYTTEIDDAEIALKDIKTQLENKITLLESTVGVVMCHTEFIATGVLEHICVKLPFDVVGVTTASQAVNDEVGEIILTIFVMTSDDIRFEAGITEDMGNDVDGMVKTAYERVCGGISELPKLAIIFPPFGLHSGDAYVRAFGQIIPGTPIFGTNAIDDSLTFSECQTIYNGESYRSAMPFVLCYGNIKPRFLIATFCENNAICSKTEITKSEGNRIYEIENGNALKFFEEKGFVESVMFTPFMIDLLKRDDYDGVPVIRGHAAFTEEGAAVFHGDIDAGSTFTMLKCDAEHIVRATRQKVDKINGMHDINGALLFPCVVRRAALLGVNKPLMELQSAKDTINPEIPFMMGYGGGEICPTSVRNGIPTNRFHNYSLVILVV